MKPRSLGVLFAGIGVIGMICIAIMVFSDSIEPAKRIIPYIIGIISTLLITFLFWRAVIKGTPEQATINTTEIVEKLRSQLQEPNTTVTKHDRIIEEKRNRILNIPNVAFHYVDKEQITNFYNDYFKEPTFASLVSEITGELSGELKGSIPKILESRAGSKDIEKWVSTIKLPDTSLNGMFLRYQRETIKSAQVTLGLEEVDIELNDLDAFDDAIENLRKRFGFEVEESVLNRQKILLKERAAERTLTKLERATGLVLVEGRFKILRQDNLYRCIFEHPVTDYLSNQSAPIVISVIISEDSLEPSIKGNYADSVGRLIPLSIYGRVWEPIDRKTGITELRLTPFAIY